MECKLFSISIVLFAILMKIVKAAQTFFNIRNVLNNFFEMILYAAFFVNL